MATVRQDMVETAIRFMLGPKVRNTPLSEQQEFLKNKGLTDEEIAQAISKVETQLAGSQSQIVAALPQQQMQGNNWQNYANLLVLIGGGGYFFYNFMTNVILPKFFDIESKQAKRQREIDGKLEEMKESLQFVMDSVQQTLSAVRKPDSSNDSANRAMTELKTEVQFVKSILLSRSQFAPIPSSSTTTLPSWQTASPTPASSKTVTFDRTNDTPDDSSIENENIEEINNENNVTIA